MNEVRETACAASCVRGDCVDARRAGAAANRAHATVARFRTRAPHARRVGETAANPGRARRPTAAAACASAGIDVRRAIRIERGERGDRRAIRLIAGTPDVATHAVTLY
ncbi:hypothetical protein CWD92_25080 [Burkholderia thailandensis]|nr:hypothetical protein A8H32_18385 [Burkholderia thailandensis]PJO69706.1 hypothetical protein CWD92_25080 [Burkholderia thailandensis]